MHIKWRGCNRIAKQVLRIGHQEVVGLWPIKVGARERAMNTVIMENLEKMGTDWDEAEQIAGGRMVWVFWKNTWLEYNVLKKQKHLRHFCH